MPNNLYIKIQTLQQKKNQEFIIQKSRKSRTDNTKIKKMDTKTYKCQRCEFY